MEMIKEAKWIDAVSILAFNANDDSLWPKGFMMTI